MIEAMPEVVDAVPNARYVVLGATHPDLLRHEGEKYRRSLEARAVALGVADQVMFVDRFVSPRELGTWLGAADIFVTPYPNLDQIVSGTLSYAISPGQKRSYRRRMPTPPPELLADGRGRLVEPSSAPALATAFNELLRDTQVRETLGARAYDHSRSMIWPQVGARYRQVFARVAQVAAPAGRPRRLTSVHG